MHKKWCVRKGRSQLNEYNMSLALSYHYQTVNQLNILDGDTTTYWAKIKIKNFKTK